jgi:hypothetical protein
MLLAGEVFRYPKHERYFQQEIALRLGSRKRFLGPVGFVRKRRLLASARCVIISSLAPQTSSLVAMEALASGTPIVTFGAGALSDIVEDGKTGFVVSSTNEIVRALQKVLNSELCRTRARERFSASGMIAQYLALYRELVQPTKGLDTRSPLSTQMPELKTLSTRSPGDPTTGWRSSLVRPQASQIGQSRGLSAESVTQIQVRG